MSQIVDMTPVDLLRKVKHIVYRPFMKRVRRMLKTQIKGNQRQLNFLLCTYTTFKFIMFLNLLLFNRERTGYKV